MRINADIKMNIKADLLVHMNNKSSAYSMRGNRTLIRSWKLSTIAKEALNTVWALSTMCN